MDQAAAMSEQTTFKCPICVFVALTIPLVLSHLRPNDPNFSVVCGIDGCCTTAKSFSALYQHIYRKHKNAGIINSRLEACDRPSLTPESLATPESVSEHDRTDLDEHDLDQLLGLDVQRQKATSALFIMKLKETRQMSQAAIDDVLEGCKTVFSHTTQRLQSGVRARLAMLGIDETACDDLFSGITDPFDGLETRHKQEKCFKEDFGLVEPEEVFVGEPYYPTRFNGSKRSLIEKRDSFQYVPLLDSLKSLLRDKSVLDYVEHPHCRSDCLLEDFCDGELVKNHPIFSIDPQALQIVAYYDELELCNPLGTHKKKHKLGILLFMLGNVPPKYRSTFRAINVVACAVIPVIERHGLDSILEPFIRDLNILSSSGVSVEVDGVLRTFKGGLLCFLADNAASNAIGGFKESFSFSFRFCRSCMATRDSYRTQFVSHAFRKRTESDHRNQCDEVEGLLGEHYSKTYGINRRCLLMKVSNFSLFDGGLPHDFMHDILEGVAQLELKLLVRHCVDQKYITVQEYNRRIVFFDYGSSESDKKPTIITRDILRSEDKKFHLSSSQTLLLCRILPLLFGECVPEVDLNWKCFVILLKIIDIVNCPVVTKGQGAILRLLIEEHHTAFKSLYSESSIIPKFHFLLHYSDQLIALGPMVRTWTMRHEAKLSMFKRAAHLGNFKNIALTLAQRHQRWMCYQLASGELLRSNFECGPGNQPQILSDMAASVVECICKALPNISHDTFVFHPTWVKKDGIKYHKNNCYVVTGSDGTDPIISRIKDVFVVSGDVVLLYVQRYCTEYYDDHFHAYIICESSNMFVVCVDDLSCPSVLHGHSLFDGSDAIYITLKHSLLYMMTT